MTTLVRIWNRALSLVRADVVVDPQETTASARACRAMWDESRDATLRAYPWNCAAARARLADAAPAPAFGFARRFPLPADCLTVRTVVGGDAAPWQVEGRAIVTDLAAPLDVVYTARVTDPGLYDALLADALSARLAFDIAPLLTESATAADAAFGRFQAILREARQADAIEGSPADAAQEFLWTDVRGGALDVRLV